MRIGVPKEVKNHEYRVAITPIGVHELVAHGHDVFVEKDAGVGSQIDDAEYVAAGASIVDTADEAWGEGEMVLKVKEPIAEEYERMREGQVLFTYLHLAADKPLTEELTEPQGHRALPTRPCSCPPAHCRCSTRCRRSPAAWLRRSERTSCSRPGVGVGCCSVESVAWPTPRSS